MENSKTIFMTEISEIINMIVTKEDHLAQGWKVDHIARDFTLWDVWEVPIEATNTEGESFLSFYNVAHEVFQGIVKEASLAGFLFTLREWIGRVIPLDRNVNTLPIPGSREISLKSRLAPNDLAKSKAASGIGDNGSLLVFSPVYLFENESLHELSNDTAHCLLHMGWIRKKNGLYTATLAVYVVPRGIMGKAYLAIINPFRYLIVYPSMMKAFKRQWHEYLARKSRAGK